MDTFARALMAAQAILDDGEYSSLRKERYASFDAGKGKQFEAGKLTMEDIRKLAHQKGEPAQISGRQEYFENMISRFI